MINMAEESKNKGKEKDNDKNNKKKEKNKKSLVRLFIILTFILLIIVVALSIKYSNHVKESKDNFDYNGYHFTKVGHLWSTTIANPKYPVWYFHFSPKQVDSIPTTGEMSDEFKSSRHVYLTFNPNETNLSYTALVAGDLTLGLVKYFDKTVRPACTLNTTECENVTIITCEEAEKEHEATIFLNQDGPAQITYGEYCIEIQGRQADLVRASEDFLMKYYGIIR